MCVNLIRMCVIAALCAACGGGGGDGEQAGPDAGGAGSTEIDACQLVTQEDAATLFGHPASREQGAETIDPALLGECLWTWEAADASNELLAIYVWDNANGLYYSQADGAQPFDIGEDGYIVVDDFTGVDLGWRQEGLAIFLDFVTIGPMVPAATSKVDEVKAIAAQVEARL